MNKGIVGVDVCLNAIQHIFRTLEGRYGFYHTDDVVVVQVFQVEQINVAARFATEFRTPVLSVEDFATEALFFFFFFQFLLTLFFFDGSHLHTFIHFFHMDVLNAESGSQQGDFYL